jgi:predicted ATPase
LWPTYLALLAEALVKANQNEEAFGAIDEALATVRETSEGVYESELHRLRGTILLQLSQQQNEARAEKEYLEALEIARNQAAKSLELRAATSLAGLWRDRGKVQQARELLAPIYSWFTEGFDTLDLKEAKALLDELACCDQSLGVPSPASRPKEC